MNWKKLCGMRLVFVSMATLRAATLPFIDYGNVWQYRIGTNEASAPVTDWRTNGDYTGWSAPVPTPIGYGEAAIVTTIPGSAATTPTWLCIFMRRSFVVTNPASISSLNLSINIDDGYIVWLHGTEVARTNVNLPSGQPTIDRKSVV